MFAKLSNSSKINLLDYHHHLKHLKKLILQDAQSKDQFNMQMSDLLGEGKVHIETSLYFPNIPGRNPSSWPHKIDEFIENLMKLPYYTFFEQPMKLHKNYFADMDQKMAELTKNISQKPLDDTNFQFLCKLFTAEFLSSLLKGSFSKFIKAISKLVNILPWLSDQQNLGLTKFLKKNLKSLIKEIVYSLDKEIFDFNPMTYQMDCKFALNDTKIFDFLQSHQEYCFTTDGTYLYELINNSGKLLFKKFGTGEGDTKPGTLYLAKSYSTALKNNLSMVHYKGKLYINNNCQRGVVQVFDPNDFKALENVNLNLESYFKNPHLNQYNEKAKIFTDGQFIYTILMKAVTIPKKEPEVATVQEGEQAKEEPSNPDEERKKQEAEKQGLPSTQAQETDKNPCREAKKVSYFDLRKQEFNKQDFQTPEKPTEAEGETSAPKNEGKPSQDKKEIDQDEVAKAVIKNSLSNLISEEEARNIREKAQNLFKGISAPRDVNHKFVSTIKNDEKREPVLGQSSSYNFQLNVQRVQSNEEQSENDTSSSQEKKKEENEQKDEDDKEEEDQEENEESEEVKEIIQEALLQKKDSSFFGNKLRRMPKDLSQRLDPYFFFWDQEDLKELEESERQEMLPQMENKDLMSEDLDNYRKQMERKIFKLNELQKLEKEQNKEIFQEQEKMLTSLRSINVIKNIFKNQNPSAQQKDLELRRGMRNPFRKARIGDFDKDNIFANIFENEIMMLNKQNLENLQKMKLARPVPENKEQETYKIEFYLVKFDLNEHKDKQKQEEEKYKKIPEVLELCDTFSGLFSLNNCGYAYHKNDKNIQQAAKYLIEQHQNGKPLIVHDSVEETLIYQTFSSTSLCKNTPIKLISVRGNSILQPQDVYGNWFVKGKSLLKSTGQLFSTEVNDQITVAFDAAKSSGQDIFSERRNSKLHAILQKQDLDPEYVDVLYKQLRDEADEHKLKEFFLIRNMSKDSAEKALTEQDAITTTYIKTYQSSFFKQGSLVEMSYDYVNHRFAIMNFYKMPKTSNNFIKQMVVYYNDNFKETKYLQKIIKTSNEYKINPFLYYLDIVKAKNLKELTKNLLEFVLWINVNRSVNKKRINDWEFILQYKLDNLEPEHKNKQSSFKKNILKLKELRSKTRSQEEYLTWIESDKQKEVRHLQYNYYMCLKGNSSSLLQLYKLFKQETVAEIKENVAGFLKLFSIYGDFEVKAKNLVTFEELIFNKVKENSKEDIELLVSLGQFLAVHSKFTNEVMQYSYQNNQNLFLQMIKKIFEPFTTVSNYHQFNQRLFVQINEQNELKQSNTLVPFSFKEQIITLVMQYFLEDFKNLENLLNLVNTQENPDNEMILMFSRKVIEFMLNKNKYPKGNQLSDEQKRLLAAQFNQKEQVIFNIVLKHSRRILGQINLSSQSNSFREQFIYWINFLSYFIVNKKIRKTQNLSEIFENILAILSEFKSHLLGNEISLEVENTSNMEGIAQLDSHVFETPHPIERGKTIKFKNLYVPNAFGFLVEFDKNCQDEENTDQLVFNSWYDQEPKGNLGNIKNCYLNKMTIINSREKQNKSTTLIMVGDSLSIKFISSLVARQNLKSLSQWGYKLIIRPIFVNDFQLNSLTSQERVQNNMKLVLRCMEGLAVSMRIILDYFLKGEQKGKQQEFTSLLKWKILQLGLSYLKSDKFLILRPDGSYQIKNENIFSNADLYNFTNESEVQSLLNLTKNNDKISIGEFREIDFQELIQLSQEPDNQIFNLIEIVKQMTPETFFMKMERQRSFFTKELQAEWNQTENMVILSYIKHTNLLQLVKSSKKQDFGFLVKEKNIQELLAEIGVKKNHLNGFMLKELEVEREHNNLVTSIFDAVKEFYFEQNISLEVKEEPKEVQEDKKLSKKEMIKKLMSKRSKKKKKKTVNVPVALKKKEELNSMSLKQFEDFIGKQELKIKMSNIISESYENKEDKLQKIFHKIKLNFTREPKVNFNFLLNYLLEFIRELLMKQNQDLEKLTLKIEMRNPYLVVAEKMKQKCEFLLRLDQQSMMESDKQGELATLDILSLQREISLPTKQDFNKLGVKEEGEELLPPIPINRSLTSDSKNKQKYQNNLKKFENWIENYKNWKNLMTDKHQDLESGQCSQIFAVNEFLCLENNVNISLLEEKFLNASNCAALRIIGLQYLRQSIDLVRNSWLEKYFTNVNSSIYSDLNILHNIQISNFNFKKIVTENSFKIAGFWITKISKQIMQLKELTSQDFYKFKKKITSEEDVGLDLQIIKMNSFLQDLLIHQIELFSLINNDQLRQNFNKLEEMKELNDHHLTRYMELNLELILLSLNAQKMSLDFRLTVVLFKKIQSISEMIFHVIKDNYNKKKMFDILLSSLSKEINKKQSQINSDFIRSLDDVVKKSRIKFLLKQLTMNMSNSYQDDLQLTQCLCPILQHSSDIFIVKACCQLLQKVVQNNPSLLQKEILKDLKLVKKELPKEDKIKIKSLSVKLNEKQSLFDNKKSVIEENFSSEPNLVDFLLSLISEQVSLQTKETDGNYYQIMCHFESEQGLLSLIRLFYFWEMQNPTFSLKYPKTMKEYQEFKKKSQAKPEKTIKTSSDAKKNHKLSDDVFIKSKLRFRENILDHIPEVNIDYEDLNLGWQLQMNKHFNQFKSEATKPKEIIVKQVKTFLNVKSIEISLNQLNENMQQLQLPGEREVKEKRKVLQSERNNDVFEDDYGYCLDLMFESYQNLVEKIKEISEANKKPNVLIEGLRKEKKRSVQEMMSLKEKIEQKKQELLMIEKKVVQSKKEKPKSQDFKKHKALPRKKSEFVQVKKKQEEEFLASFRFLKTLHEITKNIFHIGQFLNYMGQAIIVLQSKYFMDTKKNVLTFANMMELLTEDRIAKIIPEDNLSDPKTVQNLKSFFQMINKSPSKDKFVYSILRKNCADKYSEQINFINQLQVPQEDLCKYINKLSFIHYKNQLSLNKSAKTRQLIDFFLTNFNDNQFIQSQIKQKIQQFLKIGDTRYDPKILGLMVLHLNWGQDLIIGEEAKDSLNQKLFVVSNIRNTGKNTLQIIRQQEQLQISNFHGTIKRSTNARQVLKFYQDNIDQVFEKMMSLIEIVGVEEQSMRKISDEEFYFERLSLISLLNVVKFVLQETGYKLQQNHRNKFMSLSNEIFESGKDLKREFHEAIEKLLDHSLPQKIFTPSVFDKPPSCSFILEPKPQKKSSVCVEQKQYQNKDDQRTFTHTKSSHIEGIKASQPKVVEYKMLKYWDKHIIPKIHNFVKGTLSQFEVEEFTEQMRIELRKNNFSKASNIAYILCDQKLPSNCYLPGLNYDWNTLNLDEVKIGQWVCIKIKDERNLFSPLFEEFLKMNVLTLMGLVIQKNHSIESVCVLVQDLSLSYCYSVWVPQQAVKALNNTLDVPSNFSVKKLLMENFEKAFQRYSQGLIRSILMKDLFVQDLSLFDSKIFENIKMCIQYELKGDCLKQWLINNQNFASSPQANGKLEILLKKITEEKNLPIFLEKLMKEGNELIEFFLKESYHCDLQKTFKDQFIDLGLDDQFDSNSSNLNIFTEKHKINGIVIEFESPSNLFRCSGIKFFEDPKGINMIKHIQASQQHSTHDLEPIVFNRPDVFFEFYYNKEALPPYISQSTTTSLQANVFAISQSWNYMMWSIDCLSTVALKSNNSELMSEILSIFLNFFKNFKGPSCAQKNLLELFCRILIKLRQINKKQPLKESIKELLSKKNLDLSPIFTIFEQLKTLQKDDELPSSPLQQIVEFMAIFIICCEDFKLDHDTSRFTTEMVQVSKLFELAEFLQDPKQSNVKVIDELRAILDPLNNFKQFILIENIPALQQQSIEGVLLESIKECKLKILSKELDVYIPSDTDNISVGYVIILFDGFQPLNQEDVKEDLEEEEEEAPPVNLDRQWQCDRCTLLNPDNSDICVICEAPKPANPIYPNEELEKDIEEVEVDKKCISQRLQGFKNSLSSKFERLTPDKRIKISSFEKEDSSFDKFKESNELMEFMMIRTTSEKFQQTLKKIVEDIFSSNKEKMNKDGIASPDQLHDEFVSNEPLELFQLLSFYGYDLWLEKVCPQKEQKLSLIPLNDLLNFQEFFQDLYFELDDLNNYKPQNLRLEFKNALCGVEIFDENLLKKVSYKESKEFYYKMMKFNYVTNLDLKCSLAAIYRFNQLLAENFEWLIIHQASQVSNSSDLVPFNLGSILFNSRAYFCPIFKNQIKEKLLEKTSVQRDSIPKIVIERITKEKEILHIPKASSNEMKLYSEKTYTFIQAFNQINQISLSQMRPPKPRGNDSFICFEIKFKGEHVMGESGPYRQFFADIINELQSPSQQSVKRKLDLFIPTPNQLSDIGDYKDKFTINPSCKTPYHLQLFEFLGLLMGCAFRTEIYLSLDLPQIFWKKLVNEAILEQDIEELDQGVLELIKYFKNCQQEDFENIFENYSTYLSDKTEVELVPGGKNIKVEYQNRNDFIKKLLHTRLSEADQQIEAIKKGFSKIVPLVLLSCLNARDLETKVCGIKEIDFELLRKNTKYSGDLKEEQLLIKNFWEVLFELSEKDKLLFVKFCWGQERLPSTLQAYESRSTRFMIKPSQYSGNQDGILPRADTCFFNFELPNYSSKEIMKERILLAIHTDCDSMNAEEKQEDQNNQEQSFEMQQESENEELVY